MSERGRAEEFADHAFLKGLSQRHLTLLASGARPMKFGPGEYLGRDGDAARAFYLVQVGRVALEIHAPGRGPVPVQTVGPGQVVGWSWLVPPHRWRFDCRAADPVEALALDGDWLRGQCAQDHELGYQLLQRLVAVMAGRLTATRLQVLDLYQ